jgi:hypothetical protein
MAVDLIERERLAEARLERKNYDYLFSSDVAERLWSHVTKGDGCWEWNGYKSPSGYGIIATRGGGKMFERVHRVSWRLVNGPIPIDMVILHTCDNRACVRPDHLQLGTQEENMKDMDRKQRRVSNRHGAIRKLTPEIVREIRASDDDYSVLGEKYGVHYATIADIKKRRTWARLA